MRTELQGKTVPIMDIRHVTPSIYLFPIDHAFLSMPLVFLSLTVLFLFKNNLVLVSNLFFVSTCLAPY
jgi:hypothetical protein